MRRALASLLAVAVVSAAGGCSVTGPGTYEVTVFFPKTPSLYEKSRVKIMGANVGTIERIEVDRPSHRVKVRLSIRDDVPVAAESWAAIVSANTIGERNVVLYPPWKPGQAKMRPGSVIPQERTDLPVEIDDALSAFTNLSDSLDPEKLRSTFQSGAEMLNGNGDAINHGLQTIGDLTGSLAAQDQRIVSLATSLNDLAGKLNERDEKLKTLFKAFNDAGGMLGSERDRIKGLLSGLEALIRQGDVVIETYQEKLPSTMADASELVMTLKANSEGLSESINAMAKLAGLVIQLYDPNLHMSVARVALNATTRIWLQPLFTAMGWGQVPCPKTEPDCVDGPAKKNTKDKKKSKKKAGTS